MRRFEVESTGEDRKAHEQCLFGLGQQAIGPVDRCDEALLPGQRVARATAEQSQPVQPTRHVEAAHRPHPRGGQFDRQRQTVEPSADLGDRAHRLMVEVEIGPACLSPFGEQCVASSTGSGGTGRIRSPSTPSASRLVASTTTSGHCRTIWSTRRAAAGEDVLAVVHDQQQRARPQKLDHGGLDAKALLLLQPQRRGNGVIDGRTVIERRELAEARAVVELLLESAGDLEGQSGLSDPADTRSTSQEDSLRGRRRRS